MTMNRANDQKKINLRAIIVKGFLLCILGLLFIVFAKFGIQAGAWTTALLVGGSLPLLLVLSGMNRDSDEDYYEQQYEELLSRGKTPAPVQVHQRIHALRTLQTLSSANIPVGIKTTQHKNP